MGGPRRSESFSAAGDARRVLSVFEDERAMLLDRELREDVASATSFDGQVVVEDVAGAGALPVVEEEPEPGVPRPRESFDLTITDNVICPCGAEIPVSVRNIETARLFPWYRVNKRFNRVFYALLADAGVDYKESGDTIQFLSHHSGKQHLNLRPAQVRAAYGLQAGVCTADGKLRRKLPPGVEALEEDREIAELTPDVYGHVLLGFSAAEWPAVQEEAFAACAKKIDQAEFQDELRWVLSRMKEWPDFSTAPSRIAIKTWMILNDPAGVDPACRELLRLTMSRGLQPAEKQTWGRSEANDKVAIPEKHDTELMKRLFGDES